MSVDSCAEIAVVLTNPISGRVTKSGRVWRQVPESDARSVGWAKLQALVYDILPSTTAVFSYAIGSRKVSPNELFLLLLVLKQQ